MKRTRFLQVLITVFVCSGLLFLVYQSDVSLKNSIIAFENLAVHLAPNSSSSILVLYWTTVFGHKVNVTEEIHEWPFFAIGNNCPVKCELSSNKSRSIEASALVIHGRNIEELPTENTRSIPWIFHVNENPRFTTSIKDQSIMNKFTYLANYRLDSDFPCPEFKRPELSKPVPFNKKKGLVIAVYSHCENTRALYMFRLMKYLDIDSYGKCLQNKPRLPGGKNEVQQDMRRYKFTLVFPNADCDYYMTEKIYSALSSGSIPVWMGTDKINEVLKWGNLKHSVIKVKDFPSPKKLAKYLLYLAGNEAEYNKFLKWKYDGFKFEAAYYKSPVGVWWESNLSLYCRVCMKLAKNPKHRSGLFVDKCDGKQRRTLEKWIVE